MEREGIRGRRFVFTINNPTDDEINRIKNEFIDDTVLTDAQRIASDNIDILIAEHEVGVEGTPHIQGYITFAQKVYRRVVEGLLGGRAYVEIAKGSTADNITYCTKESKTDPSKQIKYLFKWIMFNIHFLIHRINMFCSTKYSIWNVMFIHHMPTYTTNMCCIIRRRTENTMHLVHLPLVEIQCIYLIIGKIG